MRIKDYTSDRRLGRDIITMITSYDKILPHMRMRLVWFCVIGVILLLGSMFIFTVFHHTFRPSARWEPDNWANIFNTLKMLIMIYPVVIVMSFMNTARRTCRKFVYKFIEVEQICGLTITQRLDSLSQPKAEKYLSQFARFFYLYPRRICHINLSAAVSAIRRWNFLQEALCVLSMAAVGAGLVLLGYTFSVNWHRPIHTQDMQSLIAMSNVLWSFPIMGWLIAFVIEQFTGERPEPCPPDKEVDSIHEHCKKHRDMLKDMNDVTI